MSIIKKWKFYGSILWVLLTLSLAIWWLINGLRLLESPSLTEVEVTRYRFMLITEGITWMILLVLGGATLIYFVLKEGRKNLETKKFVASFSHDLKTSIASLRLQAESLKEDVKDAEVEVLANRLVADSLRLQLQLENSLQFSSENKLKMFIEKISLQEVVESLGYHWPEIKLFYQGQDSVYCDRRAMDIIMRNLIYNARVHAEAKEVHFEVKNEGLYQNVYVTNDGQPFDGEIQKLGQLYYRHNPSSGSGLGLYIVKSLMNSMKGNVSFPSSKKGIFSVRLSFLAEKKS